VRFGYGCKCGKRFPTQKTADLHAKNQNLIEENEAKAKKAEGQATELALQAHETTEPAEGQEAAPDPDVHESKPEPPTASESAKVKGRSQHQTNSHTHWLLSPPRQPKRRKR
jgi:hypothetical protein